MGRRAEGNKEEVKGNDRWSTNTMDFTLAYEKEGRMKEVKRGRGRGRGRANENKHGHNKIFKALGIISRPIMMQRKLLGGKGL